MRGRWLIVPRETNGDRGVSPDMAIAWRGAERDFDDYVQSTGIEPQTVTWSTEILPLPFNDAEAALEQLAADTRDDGTWAVLKAVHGGGPTGALLAMPVRDPGGRRPELLPFLELHSTAIAWWFSSVWRARHLAVGAAQLSDQDLTVAAAATVRSLVETIAALDYDARRLRDAWSAMKEAGPSPFGSATWERHQAVRVLFLELFYGSKFAEAPSHLKAASDRVTRRNILTQVRQHAKRVEGVDLVTDYEWLCNVVHPSIGTTYVYSTPPFMHNTRTHVDRVWSGQPLTVLDRQTNTRSEPGMIETVVARAATTALRTGVEVARSTLRVIDDIALTSDARQFYRNPVFRALPRVGRNDPCSCGSGRKVKLCGHEWRGKAPGLPHTFAPFRTPEVTDDRWRR